MFKNSLKEKINSNIIVPKSIEYDIHKSIFFKKKFSYGSVDITKSENSILVEIKLTAYKENYKKYMELEANNEEIRAMNQDLERTYKKLDNLNNNLESIIELISKIDNETNKEEFLSIVLKKSMELIPEADYGLIYLFENGEPKFIDAVGYNIDQMNQLEIKKIHIGNYDKFYIKEIEDNNIIDKDKASTKIYDNYQNNIKKIKKSLLINILVNDKTICRMSIEIKKIVAKKLQKMPREL